jgi:L-arabinonolactonase
MKISRVETAHCMVGEGLVWDVADRALYFLDIAGHRIHRYEPGNGATRTWTTPMAVGAMALRERGGAVLAMQNTVATLDFDTGVVEALATAHGQPPNAVFNDGTVDKRGRFLIGSCFSGFDNPQPIGGLFSMGAAHTMTRLDSGITYSNGPCLSPDNKTLYFSDSHCYSCFAYDYDLETGEAKNRRRFADTRELGGMPDGTTVDSDGLVWMAIFRGGKVVAFRPDGKIERVVAMPVSLSVSTMFGGPDLDQLYVATIDPAYFSEPGEDGAGYVYMIEGLGARGVPRPRYTG